MRSINRSSRLIIAIAILTTVVSTILSSTHANAVLTFIVAGLALAVLAALVGDATEEVGSRLGPGATGVLQSGIGNLPELFVCIFALRQGLLLVVQATLVGSILANSLLVMGLAFLLGGLKNGTQKFSAEAPRMLVTLTILSVSALAIPTLAHALRVPAGLDTHIEALSIVCAVTLLVVFVASIPYSLAGSPSAVTLNPDSETATWPMSIAALVLVASGVGAAIVSDQFVTALTPAIKALHISETFTGLVIVAIAGNAVENVIGIRFALHNKQDYALSVILNSSLQVALGLTPVLVLLSLVIGGAHLTLVLPGLLLAALLLTVLLSAIIVSDGESTWLEGVALIGLYLIIATAFWWG